MLNSIIVLWHFLLPFYASTVTRKDRAPQQILRCIITYCYKEKYKNSKGKIIEESPQTQSIPGKPSTCTWLPPTGEKLCLTLLMFLFYLI